MGFLKVRSRLVADPCHEQHLHLQTTTVRMNSNIFGQKDSANQKLQSGFVHSSQQQPAAAAELL